MANTSFDIIGDDCWCCVFEFLTQSELFTIREVSKSFLAHATHVISNLTQVGLVDSYQFRYKDTSLNESAVISFLDNFPNISRLTVRGFQENYQRLFSVCLSKMPVLRKVQELVYISENSSFVGPDLRFDGSYVNLLQIFPLLKKATAGGYPFLLRMKADPLPLHEFKLITDRRSRSITFCETKISKMMNGFPVLRSSVEYLTGRQTKGILEICFEKELNNIANGEINFNEEQDVPLDQLSFVKKFIKFWKLIGFHPATKFNIKINHGMVSKFSYVKKQTLSRYLLQAAMCYMLGADAKGFVSTYNNSFNHEEIGYALKAVDFLQEADYREDLTDLGYEADSIAYSVAIMHSTRNQKKVLFSWYDYLQSRYEPPTKKIRL